MADSSSDGVDWYLTYCQKCNQIVGREKERAGKEAKKKAEQAEIERERAYARNAKLAEKKEREKIKYQKEVLSRGGRICPNCGHEMRAQLPELIYDHKTGESKFGPIPYTCMHCRDHYRIIFGKG